MTGLSLIELMVAMVLGLLVSLGIVTLFGAASSTARVQNGLARLQENGRIALQRMTDDLRMTGALYCGTSGGGPMLHVANFTFPDGSGGALNAGAASVLSARHFAQGYDCSPSGCAPSTPAMPAGIPAAGAAVGQRVRNADVLTVRYLRGAGWPVTHCTVRPADAAAPPEFTVTPDPQDAPFDVRAGELVLVADCSRASLFKAAVAGNVVTPVALAARPAPRCPAGSTEADSRIAAGEPRLFNASRDFTTVTYYLRIRADGNPDRADRRVPVLVRRVSDRSGRLHDEEIAEGVERLDFLYGVEDAQGRVAFLRADEVNAMTNCPPPAEDACGWRSIKSIEVHLLLNTVDDVDVPPVDTAYRYGVDGPQIAPPPATLASGLPAGRMMRREFSALVAVRNAVR